MLTWHSGRGWLWICGLLGCWAVAMAAGGCDGDGNPTQVATPAFDPGSGTFTTSVDVTILCDTVGATIRYTTDGTDPGATSTEYAGPIHLTETTTVKARAFKEGMSDSETASAAFTVENPAPAPAITSFAINDGADDTAYRIVTLNNVCTGDPTEYMASESSDFTGAAWQAYLAAPSFLLSGGSETKTVYLKVRNAVGESAGVSDTIALNDNPQPEEPVVTSLAINDGAAETATSAVTLNNVCTGDPIEYIAGESSSFEGAAWQTYSAAPSFGLSSGTGSKTVYFKVRNAVGESAVVNDTITVMPNALTIDLGNQVTMELVLVPAGTFWMGSPDDVGSVVERPRHQVTLTRAFYMGKYEVTQAQWQAVMGSNPSSYQGPNCPDSEMRPVEWVSWLDCDEFCQALTTIAARTCRLPTEAEWEYACRAGTTTDYYSGDSADQLSLYAWYSDSGEHYPHVVGGKLPNAFGLHDMHGNVLELCQDWYGDSYVSDAPVTDPAGPPEGRFPFKVVRGGHCSSEAAYCRSAYRNFVQTGQRAIVLGCRVAADTN